MKNIWKLKEGSNSNDFLLPPRRSQACAYWSEKTVGHSVGLANPEHKGDSYKYRTIEVTPPGKEVMGLSITMWRQLCKQSDVNN